MTESSGKKKIVRVESKASAHSTGVAEGVTNGPAWTPTPEAKSKSTRLRVFAAGAWAIAIGLEIWAIFGVLRQDPIKMWLLILLLVVIGALAVTGSLLWKQANRLDPASRKNGVRFFVQNQLGLIITIIAFLPLIVLIFTNKDMSGKQKALAGSIGVVALLVAGYFGTSINPPSVEQYSEESQTISQLTGEDLVFWTKSGSVFHVCAEVPDVNKASADGQIYSGTVADAHEAGKERLTLRWESEALNYCGYTAEQVDALRSIAPVTSDDVPDGAPTDEPDEEPAQ